MSAEKAPPSPLPAFSLREKIRALREEHPMQNIINELLKQDRPDFEDALDIHGYTDEPEVVQLSAMEQARCEEADDILHAMRDAENMMNSGRRDDARHRLYMALPSGARDIFHPEQGLKA